MKRISDKENTIRAPTFLSHRIAFFVELLRGEEQNEH